MLVHELFLESAVQVFDMGLHFRRTRVGPPVGNPACLEAGVEMPLELGTVVGEKGRGGAGIR